MKSWTALEVKTKVQRDLDIQDEDFVSQAELLEYINEAIDTAEAHIHTLQPDYFKKSANIALVSGTSSYSLPSDIYANKIRRLYYDNGTLKYKIAKVRDTDDTLWTQAGDQYCYEIINTSATVGPQIKLFPTPVETNATAITIWYLRNANRLVLDADVLDIPEFIPYITEYVKMCCMRKETAGSAPQAQLKAVDDQLELMKSTLADMVVDEDNIMSSDCSYYDEHV